MKPLDCGAKGISIKRRQDIHREADVIFYRNLPEGLIPAQHLMTRQFPVAASMWPAKPETCKKSEIHSYDGESETTTLSQKERGC